MAYGVIFIFVKSFQEKPSPRWKAEACTFEGPRAWTQTDQVLVSKQEDSNKGVLCDLLFNFVGLLKFCVIFSLVETKSIATLNLMRSNWSKNKIWCCDYMHTIGKFRLKLRERITVYFVLKTKGSKARMMRFKKRSILSIVRIVEGHPLARRNESAAWGNCSFKMLNWKKRYAFC